MLFVKKKIVLPFIPRDDRINFRPDANVEEVFGLSKPKDLEVTEDQQECFEGWDWASDDQELPPPEVARLTKLNKRKKN